MRDPRVDLGQAMPGATAESVLDAFDRVRPILRVTRRGRSVANAAAAAYAMLVRLFPNAEISGDQQLGVTPWGVRGLGDLPDHLAHVRAAPTRSPDRDVVIAIGESVRGADWWLGGDAWTARIARQPVAVSSERIGLGLHLAAGLVVNEVVKDVLKTLGHRVVLADGGIVWNLLDYQSRAASAGSSRRRPVTLAMFGCGSVGTSTAAVLAMEQTVSGSVITVDGDTFDPTRNPFRYPALSGRETSAKAPWVAGLLERAGWDATAYESTVGKWAKAQATPGFAGLAVSSVDDRAGRLEVTDVLAETTISVGVGRLALHVQREHLGDEFACPFCEYVDLAPVATQADVRVSLTGLDQQRVLELVVDDCLTAADLERAVAAGKIRQDRVPALLGRRLDDLIAATYAQAVVASPAGVVRIVAPHVSWISGLLAAAEVVKTSLSLPLIDRRVDLDLTGVPLGFVRRVPRDSSGRCLCHSLFRQRWVRRIYGR